MGKGSTSAEAIRDVARTRERIDGDLQFAGLRHALAFLFERGEAMSHPLGHHPRGEKAPDGATVIVRVDGGRGSSLDDVLATVVTLKNAMEALKNDDARAFHVIVRVHRDGHSQEAIGKEVGLSQSTISGLLAKGEFYLLKRLQGGNRVLA